MSSQQKPAIGKLIRALLVIPLLVITLVAAAPSLPAGSAGPFLVKDIDPGRNSSDPRLGTAMDGQLFFSADDGNYGQELWKSSGTEAGTVMVKDINAKAGHAYPVPGAETGGWLFFGADDGIRGTELWKTDDTTLGTGPVKDIRMGPDSSIPLPQAAIGGTLYMAADDGTHGRELWKSDGSATGTVLLKDIVPGMDDSDPHWLTEFNSMLYFGAIHEDKVDDGFRALWKSDGTAPGTVLVKRNGIDDVSWLLDVSGELFFLSDDRAATGQRCPELWKSDGTGGGTIQIVLDPSDAPCAYSPFDVGGTLFFHTSEWYDGCEDPRLWKSDGTPAGTVPIKEFSCGPSYDPESGEPRIGFLAAVGNALFFAADDGTNGQELWKSDGTAAGTVRVKDINPGLDDSAPKSGVVIGDVLYFTADDGTHGRELWQSNGTASGTLLVKDIFPGYRSSFHTQNSILSLTAVGPTLFFSADDGTHGEELWAFETGSCTPPAPPRLTMPTDQSSSCDPTPKFEWRAVKGAKEYQIRIADGDTSAVVIETETMDINYQPAKLLPPGSYFWRVRANNGCDWSDWSEKWWFEVEKAPPVPVPSSPEDGTRTYNDRPTFEWSATKGADSYRLQVDDTASFASPVINKSRSTTSYRPSSPLAAGAYYWRVQGVYECGEGDWSEEYDLTILPTGLEYATYLPLVTRVTD